MNISTKQEQAERIKRDYEKLTKFSSHDYAIKWIAASFNLTAEEVNAVVEMEEV